MAAISRPPRSGSARRYASRAAYPSKARISRRLPPRGEPGLQRARGREPVRRHPLAVTCDRLRVRPDAAACEQLLPLDETVALGRGLDLVTPWGEIGHFGCKTGALSRKSTHLSGTCLTNRMLRWSDPFDRLLIAQAKSEPLLLMTNDPLIARYPVELV